MIEINIPMKRETSQEATRYFPFGFALLVAILASKIFCAIPAEAWQPVSWKMRLRISSTNCNAVGPRMNQQYKIRIRSLAKWQSGKGAAVKTNV